jgi:Domain of unknown function (DUF5916)/Carbohydrate family 9 binding domain-like
MQGGDYSRLDSNSLTPSWTSGFGRNRKGSVILRIMSGPCLFVLALSLFQPMPLSAAQRTAEERKAARAVPINAAIQIDGRVDEPAWRTAPVITAFLQKDPREGEPATEQTEVRILYTKTSIFFGIRCLDSDLSRILATELRRDNEFLNDDSVSIVLDTLHDNRSGYLFRINPLGTQYDALVTDEGRVTDVNWNEIWKAASVRGEAGWTAEIEIPFKSLRITGDTDQVWGIDFERVIRRKSEFTYWSNYKRGFEFTRVSQAGNLSGLSDLDSGLKLRIKPFVKSALNQPNLSSQSDIGLEDVKFRITPDFTADFTANTDFAEADVDAQVLNLTRFPVYFPETREFFVEGAGLFDFGPGGGAASELKLFFSRSIGLSPDREPIPILGGGKLTGKARGWTVGLLDVQTGAFGRTPRRNFAVGRIKKDIFSRSNIGAIATNQDSGSPGDPYNRSFGLDGNFAFYQHLTIQTFLASTYTPGKPDAHWGGRFRSFWDSDQVMVNLELGAIQRNVNPEMGWLPRKDMRKSRLQADWKPRPNSRTVRQWFVRTGVDYITNMAGELETRNQNLTLESLFQSGDRLLFRYTRLFDLIRKPFDIQGRVPVLPGSYNWDAAQFRFTHSPNRRLSGDVNFQRQWGFYGGSNTEVTWRPLWKASQNLSISPAYQWSKVSLPQGKFTAHLINSQVNYAFNNRWLTATTVQYNSLARLSAVNFRLNYIYRPGDDFFLIYNESRTLADGPITGPWNRSIIAKITHSWDF